MPGWSTAAVVGGSILADQLSSSDTSANDTKETYTGYDSTGGLFNPNLVKGVKGESDDTVNFGIDPNSQIGLLQEDLLTGSGLFGDAALNFLGGAQGVDPFELQKQLYGQLSPQMIDQQNKDFFDMEGRIFGQGRLGSTGGSDQLGELYSQQQDARQRLLFDTFGQAQGYQKHLGDMSGLFSGLGNRNILAALGINQGANESLRLATMIGGAGRTAQYGGGGGGIAPGGGGYVDALMQGFGEAGVDHAVGNMNGLFEPGGATSFTDNGSYSGMPTGYGGPK